MNRLIWLLHCVWGMGVKKTEMFYEHENVQQTHSSAREGRWGCNTTEKILSYRGLKNTVIVIPLNEREFFLA